MKAIDREACGKILDSLFSSPFLVLPNDVNKMMIISIPIISLQELGTALKGIKQLKGVDNHGIVDEMIICVK